MQRSRLELTQLVTWAINADAGHQVHKAREAATRKVCALQKRVNELTERQNALCERNLADCQPKLLQSGQRINRLGEQVAIQRERLKETYQELTRYRQIVDLSGHAHMELQLHDIGEQIGYRQFIPADHLLAVGHGIEYWRAFAESASDEELAQAIVRVRHYAENVLTVDATLEVQRLKGRIRELEWQLARLT